MNETQKKCIKKWTKIFLIAVASIALIVGMLMNVSICLAIVALISIGVLGMMVVYLIAERVYLWRVMGILTPEEWEVVKWYDYSLISKGADWIVKELREEEEPNERHIELFERIENNVKRPKIIS